jgi:hypothetical protein
MDETPKLVTLAEFKVMTPRRQGYVSYMQAEWPGSELKKHQRNPYKLGSQEHVEFGDGQTLGVLEAQDSEE